MIVSLYEKSTMRLVIFLFLGLPMSVAADEPFNLDDPDAVFSDAAWVHYLINRNDLFKATAKCKYDPSDPSKTDDINGLPCFVASHRFCRTRGHLSGFGVESANDPTQVDITCVSDQIAEIQTVDFDHLESHRSDCPNATASAACGVAINYHCRGSHSPGFRFGFGPVERGTKADIVCIQEDITFDEGGRSLPECAAGDSLDLVPTACRQAMGAMCQQQGDMRGGVTYLDRNKAAGLAHLACIQHVQDWISNSPPEPAPAVLPEPPALPVDVIASEIDPATGQTGVLPHNALAPNRSLSHDGRVYLKFKDGELRFGVQKPELFTAPLTQGQSVDSSGYGDGDVGLPASAFHNSTAGTWEGNSSAICDPHQGQQPLTNVNRQQSVPSRKSNPYACDSYGNRSSGIAPDIGDHDCYDLTIVTVYDTGLEDELWGAKVKVIVADPKTVDAHVASVQSIEGTTPVRANLATPIRNILEPNITGDGRLIVIQGDGRIRYAVMPDEPTPPEQEPPDPCDVKQWSTFKHLHEMHGDADMTDYGIARYPLRDHEGNLLGDREMWGAYPWIDQDGDNMMFMAGASVLYYMKPIENCVCQYPGACVEGECEEVAQKYQVSGHPFYPDPQPPPNSGWPTYCENLTLYPQDLDKVKSVTDIRRREGLTFVGLWTHGKMVSPDTRNNAADFGVPAGPQFHRMLELYDGELTEIGTTIRTSINSSENRFFVHPELRPDTPREVVWHVSTQNATDEVAFDDFIDPRALVISPMNTSIMSEESIPSRFQDGFVHTGSYKGIGFVRPAHLANAATSVSDEVAQADSNLSANVQWNVPAFGYLLGGARAEPIAAGGFKGRGLWLDGSDDRLEYLVPEQPIGSQQDMADSAWFYNVSFDPRDLNASRRLLSLPDGSWLDVVNSDTLQLGKSGTTWQETVNLPAAGTLAANVWSTVGLVSTVPGSSSSQIYVYLDGYLIDHLTPADSYFRMTPGRITVGDLEGGFKGWVDDLKVIARHPNAEVVCNHARGTLVGLQENQQNPPPRWDEAGQYLAEHHQTITDMLILSEGTPFDRYICERPVDNPTSAADLASHSNYTCLGQTRRLDSEECVRSALLFPEGLFYDAPRESTLDNAFCLSCHSSTHPSETMEATKALALGLVNMPDDMRRQPMQHRPKLFGVIPMGFFTDSPAVPDENKQAPDDGEPIDRQTTPPLSQ